MSLSYPLNDLWAANLEGYTLCRQSHLVNLVQYFLQLPACEVGPTNVAHLAAPHQVIRSAQGLFEGNPIVKAVKLTRVSSVSSKLI